VTTGGVAAAAYATDREFRTKLDQASPDQPISGQEIVALQRRGEALNLATNVGAVVTLAFAVATGVIAVLTD